MPDRPADDEAYQELAAYTLSHGDPSFLHQHVIDAHGAQCAAAGDPPIQLAFALIGLYLYLERGFTGTRGAACAHAVERPHAHVADVSAPGTSRYDDRGRRGRRTRWTGPRSSDRRLVQVSLVAVRGDQIGG
jgi:hypothetical protein